MAYELSDSITVAASPSEVFNLVSDITRTGEWSAQCYCAQWEGSALFGEIGSRFTGYNRTPDREWSTVSEVVSSEPGVEFVWKVTSSGTIWGFKMEPVNRRDDATVLTEFTEFTADGETFFQEKFGEDAATQEFIRREAAVAGITETLHAIRMLLES